MVVLDGLLCFYLFILCSARNFLLVSRYVGSALVQLYSMVFVSFNSFCRRNNFCMEDYFRWCGIFLSVSDRFAAAAMKA